MVALRLVVSSLTALAGLRAFGSTARSPTMSSVYDRISIQGGRITIAHDPAKSATPQGSVIVLHGLGDSSRGWADVAAMWSARMPTVRFVLPTAPERPVTLNGGMRMTAWYDILSLDADRADQPAEGIDESKAAVEALVAEEAALVGGAGKVVLAGFSQGGAVALYAGLQRAEEPLAGVLCMSGYLPKAGSFQAAPASKGVPVLFCHGDSDQVVRYAWGEASRAALAAQGCTALDFKTYPGMEHSACEVEIKDGAHFIAASLGVAL
mmetsp:Transcript_3199/g.10589  ORF Transcript_3199/g.10589 Transcript_3199/m.10589 type:complete len:266 (-) Transcript_3199:482-1279(-)